MTAQTRKTLPPGNPAEERAWQAGFAAGRAGDPMWATATPPERWWLAGWFEGRDFRERVLAQHDPGRVGGSAVGDAPNGSGVAATRPGVAATPLGVAATRPGAGLGYI